MQKDELLLLYDYTSWANRRLLDAAADLSPAEFTAAQPATYGSLRGILEHIFVAYSVWYARLEDSPIILPGPAEFPDIASYSVRLAETQANLRNFLLALDDAELGRVVSYRTSKGIEYNNILWQIIVHLLNHTTQHRSEAAEILTRLGHSPGDLDLIVYLRQGG